MLPRNPRCRDFRQIERLSSRNQTTAEQVPLGRSWNASRCHSMTKFLFACMASTLALGCAVRETTPGSSATPTASSNAQSPAMAGDGARYRFVRVKAIGELEFDFYRGREP